MTKLCMLVTMPPPETVSNEAEPPAAGRWLWEAIKCCRAQLLKGMGSGKYVLLGAGFKEVFLLTPDRTLNML